MENQTNAAARSACQTSGRLWVGVFNPLFHPDLPQSFTILFTNVLSSRRSSCQDNISRSDKTQFNVLETSSALRAGASTKPRSLPPTDVIDIWSHQTFLLVSGMYKTGRLFSEERAGVVHSLLLVTEEPRYHKINCTPCYDALLPCFKTVILLLRQSFKLYMSCHWVICLLQKPSHDPAVNSLCDLSFRAVENSCFIVLFFRQELHCGGQLEMRPLRFSRVWFSCWMLFSLLLYKGVGALIPTSFYCLCFFVTCTTANLLKRVLTVWSDQLIYCFTSLSQDQLTSTGGVWAACDQFNQLPKGERSYWGVSSPKNECHHVLTLK